MAGLVEGKVALVTGGGSGIGRAAAKLFAAEGARVAVADIDGNAAEETASLIGAEGGEARAHRVDVSQEADVASMVTAVVEHFGALDCALNNAGIVTTPALMQAVDLEDWQRTLGVNLTGVFLSMKHELQHMQAQGQGAIVNMSSGAGVIGTPGMSPYCATKHGVLGLTKTAALENARTGVRVNAICPGSIDTPMLRGTMDIDPAVERMVLKSMPIGRLGGPDEIAEAAVWLCSDRASLVTGATLGVDGGAVAR